MNPEKALKNYLSQSVRLLSVDANNIANLLGNFSDEQLKRFWIDYKRDRDYSRTEASGIPDWQTKNREKYFEIQMMTDTYSATKDKSGKYVYEISGLKKHLITVLTNDTLRKINEKIHYKNLSFIEKLPYLIGVSFFIMIPLTGLAYLINNVLFIIAYSILGFHYLLYPIVKWTIKLERKNKSESKTK
jgi:hypothetical protein